MLRKIATHKLQGKWLSPSTWPQSDLESSEHTQERYLTGSQSHTLSQKEAGSTGEGMVHAGITSAWRQNMTASERKNGDKFLSWDQGGTGSSVERFQQASKKGCTSMLEPLDSSHTTLCPTYISYMQPQPPVMATCGLVWLSLLSEVMETSDIDRIKWQTWVHGKCNQTWQERGMHPHLSEWPGSVPLISSLWGLDLVSSNPWESFLPTFHEPRNSQTLG